MIGQMQGLSPELPFPSTGIYLIHPCCTRAVKKEKKKESCCSWVFFNVVGKYQLQVFPDAGHFIHEDQAEKTAMVVADFYRRNDRSELVLPPKVGTVPKPKT